MGAVHNKRQLEPCSCQGNFKYTWRYNNCCHRYEKPRIGLRTASAQQLASSKHQAISLRSAQRNSSVIRALQGWNICAKLAFSRTGYYNRVGRRQADQSSKPSRVIASDNVPVNSHMYVGGVCKLFMLTLSSAYFLDLVCQLSNVSVEPSWMPWLVGAGIGLGFTILNRFGMRRMWMGPSRPLNVVITGSTRGIGKAVARELLKKGDRVMVSSSSPINVRQALKELRDEVGCQAAVYGVSCNVSSPGAVQRLVDAAVSCMGRIDVWINNAGFSGQYKGLLEMTPKEVQMVVQTNLLGSLLCTKAAVKLMKGQEDGGQIFNIDGAGADGLPTPFYAAYGATKAGIAQLMGSLNEENEQLGVAVGVHTLSPGMVLTPLLLEGATDRNKAIFNILCEQPETVAAFLTPRLRTIAARGGVGKYVRYLTVLTAIRRFLNAPFNANRFFGKQGEPLYLEEKLRILDPVHSKITRKLAQNAARRDKSLAIAYSLSLTASYALLVANSLGVLPRLPFS